MSLSIGKSYLTIWSIDDKGKYCTARATSSKKNKDGTYTNSNWNLKFVGNAVGLAKTLKEKDRITVTSAVIESIWDKEAKKNWVNVIVFEVSANGGNSGQAPQGFTPTSNPDELPFR